MSTLGVHISNVHEMMSGKRQTLTCRDVGSDIARPLPVIGENTKSDLGAGENAVRRTRHDNAIRQQAQ